MLNHQNSDGSFGLSQNMPDTDITAMAISALSLCNDSQEIDNAINKAFLYLSSIQKNDGSFTANPNESEGNSESISQVIIAMKRYGLSPHDSFFTKNGYTPYDALDSYRISGGGYLHLKSDADANQIASEQALLALTEVQKPANMLIYDRIWFDANVKYLESITK
ncbi:MAG: prenyltransferase/squalene oxidase repeat-containing protein [Monoglobus pectinilyticus]